MSEGVVGQHLPAPTLMTGDLDLATASLALSAPPPESLVSILRRADPTFEAVMPLDPKKPPARFRNAEGYLVDLITPVPKLQAGAMPLQHIAWLIEDPIPTVALWGAGVPVSVPQPSRYAVHKLILAQKRTSDRLKRAKDLAQGTALVEALLRHDRFALEDAVQDAISQGKAGWADPLTRSLEEVGLTNPFSG